MELITPSIGLLFWMLIGFGILVIILGLFAFPIIIRAINGREQRIAEQLNAANQAREEMKNLQSQHEALLVQAKEERDAILAEARRISEQITEEARTKAANEAQLLIEDAKMSIHFEKMKAVTDIKNEIAQMSIEIAEKVLQNELSNKEKQVALISQWVNDVSIN